MGLLAGGWESNPIVRSSDS